MPDVKQGRDARSGIETINPEHLARAEAALLTLPLFTRTVFLANRIDDLNYAGIARITGESVERVQHEKARALHGYCRAMDGQPLRWKELTWPSTNQRLNLYGLLRTLAI